MEKVSKEAILERTHYGAKIYSHILRNYYPGETVMTITGRDCGVTRNPFNDNKETLHIWIQKENILRNVFDKEKAYHQDSESAIPSGDAFAFAELHYKQQGDELLQTINRDMCLRIGEKFDFYANGKKIKSNSDSVQSQCSPSGDLGGYFFSFFKAPISNTKPYKAVSLLDAHNYIVGEYAKQRTDKLRAMLSPLSCGEGQGERLKKARFFKSSNFDYCTFSGAFTSRNDNALVKHSGLLCVDFDHLNDVSTLFNSLLNDEYFDTQLLFRSPSGNGLKWVIPIDITRTMQGVKSNEQAQNSNSLETIPSEIKFAHSEFFDAVANYISQTYGVEVDKSGRDVSRACFLPHDPQAFINPLILKQNDTVQKI